MIQMQNRLGKKLRPRLWKGGAWDSDRWVHIQRLEQKLYILKDLRILWIVSLLHCLNIRFYFTFDIPAFENLLPMQNYMQWTEEPVFLDTGQPLIPLKKKY